MHRWCTGKHRTHTRTPRAAASVIGTGGSFGKILDAKGASAWAENLGEMTLPLESIAVVLQGIYEAQATREFADVYSQALFDRCYAP